MKILVLGAGVIGTVTAYCLARDGHDVTLVDKNPEAGRGASYSNAGMISPGDATAWASPGAMKTFVQAFYRSNLGVKVRLPADPYFYAWSFRFLLQCTTSRMRASTETLLRLALYSKQCINEISSETGLSYDERNRGVLYLYRSQRSFDEGVGNYRFLEDHGLSVEAVDRNRIVDLEPGLAHVRDSLAGGIYSPLDQTGDSFKFVQGLSAYAVDHLGLKTVFGTSVEKLVVDGDHVRGVSTSAGLLSADAIVLSMGSESGLLGRRIGIDLPVYPVKGYTATVPLLDISKGPTMGGADEDNLTAYSRLGNRLRLASTMEFAGFDRGHKAGDFSRLLATGNELFPGAFDPAQAELFSGLRPMMPSSVPLIGRARYQNLYLNTGHGRTGWTMACGSGRLLADLVAGRKTGIDPKGLIYKG
ncbi:MAG TPA: D-amino acid dehydrogenase [Rhizobium sp.]